MPHWRGLSYVDDAHLNIHDSGAIHRTNLRGFLDLMEKAMDSNTVIFFQMKEEGKSSLERDDPLAAFSDTVAGAAGIFDCDTMKYIAEQPSPFEEEEPYEGSVHVGPWLWGKLE